MNLEKEIYASKPRIKKAFVDSRKFIRRGKTEILVPYGRETLRFGWPLTKTASYEDTARQILEANLKIPTANQIFALLNTALFDKRVKDIEEYKTIRESFHLPSAGKWGDHPELEENSDYWLFKLFKYTREGVFVIDDIYGEGPQKKIDLASLREKIKDGREFKCGKYHLYREKAPRYEYKVIFSRNKSVGFIPDEGENGGYSVGSYDKYDFCEHPFVVAICGGEDKSLEFFKKYEGSITGSWTPKKGERDKTGVCSISLCGKEIELDCNLPVCGDSKRMGRSLGLLS